MFKKLPLLFIISVAFSYNWKLDFSTYDDGTSFMRESGIEYTYVTSDYELFSSYSDMAIGSYFKRDFSVNYDHFIDKKISSFMFASYSNNTQTSFERSRVGAGYSYLLNDNVLNFPYRNKISLAIVSEYGKNYLSFRYKFKGYINKLGIESVINHLGYTYNVKSKLSYNLDSNISIFYKSFIEEYKVMYRTSSMGVEVKI